MSYYGFVQLKLSKIITSLSWKCVVWKHDVKWMRNFSVNMVTEEQMCIRKHQLNKTSSTDHYKQNPIKPQKRKRVIEKLPSGNVCIKSSLFSARAQHERHQHVVEYCVKLYWGHRQGPCTFRLVLEERVSSLLVLMCFLREGVGGGSTGWEP